MRGVEGLWLEYGDLRWHIGGGGGLGGEVAGGEHGVVGRHGVVLPQL